MEQSPLASVLADREIMEEIRRKMEDDQELPKAREVGIDSSMLRSVIAEELPRPEAFSTRPFSEAIILLFGRPALLVRNDSFEVPKADTWKDRLYPTKSKLERSIKSVGRVELLDHDTFDWVGTAWVIAENVVVTNRHVAMVFGEKKGKGFAFSHNSEGRSVRAKIDFKEEHKQDAVFEAAVSKILFIEELGERFPDMALLQLSGGSNLPEPIKLSLKNRSSGEFVASIGYPARDSRSDQSAMIKVFGDIYDVKRFAPGTITSFNDSTIFTHDCSTLGGNSGSVLIDIETGDAVGLHYAGIHKKANYAVKAKVIDRTLAKLKVVVAKPAGRNGTGPASPQVAKAGDEAAPKAGDYADRVGYRKDFLGTGRDHEVPAPALGKKLQGDAVNVPSGANGKPNYLLHYTHFSLAMNGARKMAYFTASNIDGTQLRRIPRANDRWLLDPRIPSKYQAGGDVYANNDLDKGHLVRRLDPVWGPPAEAARANDDTFHYTNACPQHKDFNQKTWNDLEDYVLDNAGAHELKISVFTGPVFRDDDPRYRTVRLPRQFWKVVAMVKEEDRSLSATGYMLSQADMITGLEFVFGAFRTYQVPIRHIEKLTGLSFGKLRDHDPKGKEEGAAFQEITGADDLVF